MIVILDRQHAGKPGKDDRGASVELDGRTVYEVDLTRAYIEAATALLMSEGHAVYVLEDGWYSARHARACEIARENPAQLCAYVACHINAGGGSYGLVLHDARSRGGHALAEAVADALGTDNAALDRTLVGAADHEGPWARAMTTIKGIYSGPGNLSGICFEPFFIDNDRNQALMTDAGLRAVGNALAVGCMQWGE